MLAGEALREAPGFRAVPEPCPQILAAVAPGIQDSGAVSVPVIGIVVGQIEGAPRTVIPVKGNGIEGVMEPGNIAHIPVVPVGLLGMLFGVLRLKESLRVVPHPVVAGREASHEAGVIIPCPEARIHTRYETQGNHEDCCANNKAHDISFADRATSFVLSISNKGITCQ